jgi:hypothetical protein
MLVFKQLLTFFKKLWLVYTFNVGLWISLSDANSLENLQSFEIASTSSSNKYLLFSPLWKHHYSRLLALPTNIRLGWKSLPGTNTLVYYENSKITDVIV